MEEWTKNVDDKVCHMLFLWKLERDYGENGYARSQLSTHEQGCRWWTIQAIPNGYIWFSSIDYVTYSAMYFSHPKFGFVSWRCCENNSCKKLRWDVCSNFSHSFRRIAKLSDHWRYDVEERQGVRFKFCYTIICCTCHNILGFWKNYC